MSGRFGDRAIVIITGHAGEGIIVVRFALPRGLVTGSFVTVFLHLLAHLLVLLLLLRIVHSELFLVRLFAQRLESFFLLIVRQRAVAADAHGLLAGALADLLKLLPLLISKIELLG